MGPEADNRLARGLQLWLPSLPPISLLLPRILQRKRKFISVVVALLLLLLLLLLEFVCVVYVDGLDSNDNNKDDNDDDK